MSLQRCPPPLEALYILFTIFARLIKRMKNEIVQDLYLQGAKARTLTAREMLDQRRDELSKYTRLGRFLLAKSAGSFSLDIAQRQLGADRFIGNGGEQIVFGAETEVMKVLVGTIGYSDKHLGDKLTELRYNEQNCKAYLKNQWLDTNYIIRNVGGRGFLKQKAIIAKQPKIDAPISFNSTTGLIDFVNDAKPFKLKLAMLASNIQSLHRQTGLYPDIASGDNIVVADRYPGHHNDKKLSFDFVIIDTVPVDKKAQAEPFWNDPSKTRGEAIAEAIELLSKASRN